MNTPTSSDLRAAALEMQELDRRIARLTLLEAQLRSLPDADGILAAIQCRKARSLLKFRWGHCAERLRNGVTMTTAQIRALVRELEAQQRAAFNAEP